MKIVYHPGTGTIINADECMIFDAEELRDEGYGLDIEEVLNYVDVVGVDLGALLEAVAGLKAVGRGVTTSQFDKAWMCAKV